MGNIWATIKDNKNLDLPAHRVMVATVRCDQSIADLCRDFEASAEVGALREEAVEGILDDYGERCWGLVEARLRSFDEMVEFFEPSVCQTKRQELNSRLQICMREATSAQLEFCRAGCLDLFRGRLGSLGADEFAVGCDVAEQEALALGTYHISLHDAAVDARADGILVRIEPLVIGCPRHPILLHHAGRVRVMLDHNSVLPPSHLGHISVVSFVVWGGVCSRARGGCDGDEGD